MDTQLDKKFGEHGKIVPLGYDRSKVKAGIVHIGVGNFHRAHEAFYTNLLLKDPSQYEWGICGVDLLKGDERVYKALKEQDNLYTLTVCGRDGNDEAYEIGSLVDLIWGVENPQDVINKIADKETKIITLTITEGGYNIDKATGAFLLEEENIREDLKNRDHPQTVFGFLAAGLRKRMQSGNGPITILSCDNLQHNGCTAKLAFTSFIKVQDPELAEWMENNVTFPNSMVDRITPAVTPGDIERLDKKNRVEDAAPVYSEDFIQWVIEDDFPAGRPAWERVGVEFTEDVSAYENMKLSLLNASHSMLSYPAFLAGYRKVDEAMRDELFVRYLRDFMNIDITPYVPAPGSIDLDEYKETLIERFGNRSVSDQISRLCFDGGSKIPVYIMPNLQKMIRDEADLIRVAFFTAAYRHYLKYQKDDLGNRFEVNEPWLTREDWEKIGNDDPLVFLTLSPFGSSDLRSFPKFKDLYLKMVKEIREKGVKSVLKEILSNN